MKLGDAGIDGHHDPFVRGESDAVEVTADELKQIVDRELFVVDDETLAGHGRVGGKDTGLLPQSIERFVHAEGTVRTLNDDLGWRSRRQRADDLIRPVCPGRATLVMIVDV